MSRFQYNPEELNFLEKSLMPFAVYQFIDKKVVTLAVTRGFMDMFNIPNREIAIKVLDNDMYRSAHPEDVSRIADAAYRFASGETENYQVIYRTKIRDEYRIIRSWGKHVTKPTGERIFIVWYFDEGPYLEGSDSESDNYQESIHRALRNAIQDSTNSYSASYDQLTGLPNMSHFIELCEENKAAIDAGEMKPAMLFFDLSGMKIFNEKFGFTAGSELLRQVAEILKKYFTAEGCSRLSGDHFAALTEDMDLEERLTQLLGEIENINNGNSLPMRIGVYGPDQPIVAEVSIALDRAKMACDTIKDSYVSGINYFDESMLRDVEMKQYVIGNIDKAIKEGWIRVYHQPIVRTANGLICDEEALARWDDPERGMIMPDVFIPILEDSRLIYKLDLYVADQILEKMKRQVGDGVPLVPESVNLSRADFYSCDVVEEIRKRVDAAGIDHSRITIEITESMVGSDLEYMKEQVERFQELGFKVWMDDFGSGYSSPSILQQIRFDTIKFDMQFMREFDNTEANRIILTELVKMVIALGIETVVEGVETGEQIEFLKEIGCTKVQGYYYHKPSPYEYIVKKSKTGFDVGYENPKESEYYAAIGKVNLYDMGLSAEDDKEYGQGYFDTMPMAILEIKDDEVWVARANKPYKDFFFEGYWLEDGKPATKRFDDLRQGNGNILQKSLRQCASDGKRILLDEKLPDGSIMHVLIRRIAINPVSGVTALSVVIIGSTGGNETLTYADVAQVLSSDYIDLFYVDLDTEEYIEYGSGESYDDIEIARHGRDFFTLSRKNAEVLLYKEDLEPFLYSFTKENIIDTIDKTGAYTYTYRMLKDGEPIYTHMKVVRLGEKENRIIIGVSNIDAQKKQQESYEKIREEHVAFGRIAALSGDYIFIYSVDPVTGEYHNYGSREDAEKRGIYNSGNDFFGDFRKLAKNLIYIEDMEMVLSAITRENVLAAIKRSGGFSINYRIVESADPFYVQFKAVMVEEQDSKEIIVGVININDQVKREQEYINNLTAARNEANRDELTGVKNKHAYVDVEDQINSMIDENDAPNFAVVVLDINGLKQINDTLGHQAGDEHIKKGCEIVCRIFRHSPVYRVGGDEFAVIAQGGDYRNIEKLMDLMHESNERNIRENGVVIACGMARYHNEKRVSDVFEKADELMYENKRHLKELQQA